MYLHEGHGCYCNKKVLHCQLSFPISPGLSNANINLSVAHQKTTLICPVESLNHCAAATYIGIKKSII